MFFSEKNNKEKGATAIILTVLILGVILLIAMGLSLIFVQEIKNSGLVSQSGPAFYAADAGAEFALFQILKNGAAPQAVPLILDKPTNGFFIYDGTKAEVTWGDTSINSVGKFGGTRRRVQINW